MKSKSKFQVVVPLGASQFMVNVEAHYFDVDEGILYFQATDGTGYVAAFHEWVYVVKED